MKVTNFAYHRLGPIVRSMCKLRNFIVIKKKVLYEDWVTKCERYNE